MDKRYTYGKLKVWWHDANLSLFCCFIVHKLIPLHSYNTFIRRHSSRYLSIAAGQLGGNNLPWVPPRIELVPALQQAEALTTNWDTPHPNWATPHPKWTTPHP